MDVKNKIMYHYHRSNMYDDMWKENNRIIVDNNFKSYYTEVIENFSTAVKNVRDEDVTFSGVLNYYLDNFNQIDEKLGKRILITARNIISSTNILNRERALEEYRKNNYPNLPSRIHSIWLTDKNSLEFWETALESKSMELYKLSVTGKMFKSSDLYIPNDNLTNKDMYEVSSKYWNPEFNKETDKKAEYLFQGKVKILKKM